MSAIEPIVEIKTESSDCFAATNNGEPRHHKEKTSYDSVEDVESASAYKNIEEENHLQRHRVFGARCGEIFVTKNARKWTFICTFCDKITTEIEDFIFHIKQAHIQLATEELGGDQETEDEDDENEHTNYITAGYHHNLEVFPFPIKIKNEVPTNFTNLNYPSNKGASNEFLDYNSYLDVKVHTHPESIYNNESNNDKYDGEISPNEKNSIWRNPFALHESSEEDDDDHDNSNGNEESQIKSEKLTSDDDQHDYDGVSENNEDQFEEIRPDDDYSKQHINKLPPVASDAATIQPSLATSQRRSHRRRNIRLRRTQIRGPVYCALCNRTFQYYSLYRNHMIKHTNETPFKCPQCSKGFKSKQAIRYHMSTHQRDKAFKCTICESSYYQESQLITHLQRHQNDNTFPCMECGKLHGSNTERDIHMRIHSGERPFQCEFCFKRFRLRHHLSNHSKLHRQYKCDFCKKIFSSSVALRKPYSCQHCGKSPGDKLKKDEIMISPALSIRLVSTTPSAVTSTPLSTAEIAAALSQTPSSASVYAKPYACTSCDKTYAQLGGLNFHIKTKHPQS